MMQPFFTTSWLIAVFTISTSMPTLAAPLTCTNRQQVCFAYCAKQYHNAPRCLSTCRDLLSQCMSNGCWDSKVTIKQCGITKQ